MIEIINWQLEYDDDLDESYYLLRILVDNLPIDYCLRGKIENYETIGVFDGQKAISKLNNLYDDLKIAATDKNIQTYKKIQVAPKFKGGTFEGEDVIVYSPKIKADAKEAIQEAKDEVLKEEKSIAKLALTLPKLIEVVEDLAVRIEKLERK